ncbi:hypothetical protein BDL97_10G097300 [Sphagnum fallax]|nr:hypothetical protein BDL97_10G097300 [Sphagnum fallax]
MSDPELANSGAFCLLDDERRSRRRPGNAEEVVMDVGEKLPTLPLLVAVGVGYLGMGYVVGKRSIDGDDDVVVSPDITSALAKPKYHGKERSNTHDVEELAEEFNDFKMVLAVRNDLKMGKGKVAAQCSHATLGLYKKVFHCAPKALQRWEMCSQVKVVTKVNSEQEMLFLQSRAKSMKLPCHITIDAGRTQIAPNSRTVLAILDTMPGIETGMKTGTRMVLSQLITDWYCYLS